MKKKILFFFSDEFSNEWNAYIVDMLQNFHAIFSPSPYKAHFLFCHFDILFYYNIFRKCQVLYPSINKILCNLWEYAYQNRTTSNKSIKLTNAGTLVHMFYFVRKILPISLTYVRELNFFAKKMTHYKFKAIPISK